MQLRQLNPTRVGGNLTEGKKGVMIMHIIQIKFRESSHLPLFVKQSSGLFVLKGKETVKIYFQKS